MYVLVKGQAIQKKQWQQGKTVPTILQMRYAEVEKELDN